MTEADLIFCRDYFRDVENRNPSETEIRVLDSYWSDHCRHTTFETEIDKGHIIITQFWNNHERKR